MKLQIVNWDDNFENFKSRSVDRCSFVCVPNKQHGRGLIHILSTVDGATIYGIWNLMLGACSMHDKPRNGYLTDTGRIDGSPWTAEDMAERWRRPIVEITRAIELLSSSKVGWLIDLDTTQPTIPIPSIHEVSGKYPASIGEGKGIEEKRREGNGSGRPPTKLSRTDIELVLSHYPRKEGFRTARHNVEAALVEVVSRGVADPVVWMVDRVKTYADSDAGKGMVRDHPKLAKWWFQDGGYDDDPAVWTTKKKPAEAEAESVADTFGTPQTESELAEVRRLRDESRRVKEALESKQETP